MTSPLSPPPAPGHLLPAPDADALALALRRHGPHTLALFRRADTLTVHLRDGELTTLRRGSAGACAELSDGDGRRHLFTAPPTAEALAALINASDATSEQVIAPDPDDDGLPADILTTLPALLREVADRMLRCPAPGLEPRLVADATRERVSVVRADGTAAHDDRLRLELRVGARLMDHRQAQSLRVVSGREPALLTEGGRHLRAAEEAARAAAERAEAWDPPQGTLPVVLGPGCPGALLHEVCGHGLEADVATAPGAAYGVPPGTRVASPLVTLVDDPTAPDRAPLYRTDDEGHPAGPAVLVERGVLVQHLTDATTARRTGRPATGHGRRLDHTHPALPRMACTYLAAGDSPPEAALDGVRRGLYVRSIVAGETDMSGGGFTASVTESHLIENGRLTAPVRAATLRGTGTHVLRDIDVVCDDLDFFAYGFQCGKLAQYPLTVSVGQPTVRVAALAVGDR
ncbi:TldD/PmbA family protein [Streptomyces sp. I05A-00742]|uniref:TldD/PmbA family protein n=1 Tax=Streptomyces sp. I05A-00742 TaxID=2732853 RepID=UPI00148989AE|nr:TldD/PmbA family protein [Streptomyces sp. I05A-00742]